MSKPKKEFTVQAKAKQVLEDMRKLLSRKIPPLSPAFYNFKDIPIHVPSPIQTDGTHLYYHPETLWNDYLKSQPKLVEQFLHVVIHCLFGHVSKAPGYCHCTQQFDFAADYQALAFITLLYTHSLLPFKQPRNLQPQAWYSFGQLMGLKKHPAVPASDNHELWRCSDTTQFPFLIFQDHSEENCSGHNGSKENSFSVALSTETSPDTVWDQWQEIRQQAFQQLSSPAWGSLTNSMEEHLSASKKSQTSYKELLRTLLRLSSATGENPDDLDLMLYHFGCQLGTPIVEPCEELEESNTGSLIIAIDTSGSCSGDIAVKFLEETCKILQDIEKHWHGELILMQCDTEIQHVVCVKNPAQLSQELAKDYVLRGMGGTNFCPVFQWAANFQKSTSPLSGLLYLSDGYGEFPKQPPDYPVYFIVPQAPGEDDDLIFFEAREEGFPPWVNIVPFPITK